MSGRQLLIVASGGIHYGLESHLVREVAHTGPVTPLPGAPTYVIGLFNLRGDLVTLVDLAARLGTPRSQVSDPAIVVLSADGRTMGLEVDEVLEVVDGSTPEWTGGTPAEAVPGTFISGTGHFGDMVVLEVDVLELVRQTLT